MCLGNWGAIINTKEIKKFIKQCVDLGLKDFDYTDIYGHYTTDDDFGSIFKDDSSLKCKLFIIAKCGIKIYYLLIGRHIK